MKKLLLLTIIGFVILVGCATTNEVTSIDAYLPQVNVFDDNDWIERSDIEFYQDENNLFIYMPYNSELEGKYFLFNPPDGTEFKLSGTVYAGEAHILEKIEKSLLIDVEGITIIISQNDSDEVGMFVKSDELRWNEIPPKPESIVTFSIEESANDEKTIEPVDEKSISDSSGIRPEGSSIPDSIQEKFENYFIGDRTYKWLGKNWAREFIFANTVNQFQAFVDAGDKSANITVDKVIDMLGKPFYYQSRSERYYDRDNLPENYIMVYAAMWSDDLVESLMVEVEEGKPVFIETKYVGWFQLDNLSVGLAQSNFKDELNALGAISRDEARNLINSKGKESIFGFIVESDRWISYTDSTGSYEIVWDNGGAITTIRLFLQ